MDMEIDKHPGCRNADAGAVVAHGSSGGSWEQWWLMGAVVAHGSSEGSLGAVVAH